MLPTVSDAGCTVLGGPTGDRGGANVIQILLVDDHGVVREGFRAVLECEPDMQVVAEAASGEEGYGLYFAHRPDVVVLDIAMKGENGLATLRRLLRRDPDARVLIFSMYEDDLLATKSLELGARGYLSKSAPPETLARAVREVAGGDVFIEGRLAKHIALRKATPPRGLNALTAREFEVFQMLAEGKSVREIAGLLHLSEKTVSSHRARVMDKLHCHNVAQLARLAIRHGLIIP